jgi:hypothetical protein
MKKAVLSTKQKATLSLDSDIYKKFQKYCEANAILLSKKVEIFMRGELDWNEKNVDRRKKRKRK